MIIIHKQFTAAPLSSAFFVTSIIGLLISLFYVPKLSIRFAAAFTILFIFMLISSFVSMSKAPVGDETFINDMSVHEKTKHPRHKRIEK